MVLTSRLVWTVIILVPITLAAAALASGADELEIFAGQDKNARAEQRRPQFNQTMTHACGL